MSFFEQKLMPKRHESNAHPDTHYATFFLLRFGSSSQRITFMICAVTTPAPIAQRIYAEVVICHPPLPSFPQEENHRAPHQIPDYCFRTASSKNTFVIPPRVISSFLWFCYTYFVRICVQKKGQVQAVPIPLS